MKKAPGVKNATGPESHGACNGLPVSPGRWRNFLKSLNGFVQSGVLLGDEAEGAGSIDI
jgi:hypothetical protein